MRIQSVKYAPGTALGIKKNADCNDEEPGCNSFWYPCWLHGTKQGIETQPDANCGHSSSHPTGEAPLMREYGTIFGKIGAVLRQIGSVIAAQFAALLHQEAYCVPQRDP